MSNSSVESPSPDSFPIISHRQPEVAVLGATYDKEAKMQSCPALPEDILFNILSRLPAKSVGMCRCVCRSWRSLLSQPQFIRNQIHRSKILQQESESPMLLFRHMSCLWYASMNDAHEVFDKITISVKRLSFADHSDSWFECLCSCDGLVLVKDTKGNMFVFNPVTREIRELPISTSTVNANKTFTRCGIGYDSVSDDYKIVTLCHYLSNDDDEFEYLSTVEANVYSLKTGSFTRIESCPQNYELQAGVFVGGCINWSAFKVDQGYKPVILAFNIVEHKFSEVPLPKLADSGNLEFGIDVCGGCLCIYEIVPRDVWVMNDYGVKESWVKFRINFWPSYFLCFLNLEQVLVQKDRSCVMYNLKEGTLKEIALEGISDGYYSVQSFSESLISPYGLW